MKRRLKMGLTGLNSSQLVDKAELIMVNMNGNASFPTPEPDLADVLAASNVLKEWNEKSAFGDRRAISRRDQAADQLRELLKELSAYVSFTAKGDKDVILSSGFEVQKLPEPSGNLSQPIDLIAKRSDKAGEINLDWKVVPYAKAYQVEYTSDDPANPAAVWTPGVVTSQSRALVTDLNMGTQYRFRVKAINGQKQSAYSDVALIMAA
ncbi:fibronectin type III domain-containing protein [Cryomorphaceae bacterium 1068]|nr:fibronectin type III domain-containing protein [Cryomorphaceae bacterium 1068]